MNGGEKEEIRRMNRSRTRRKSTSLILYCDSIRNLSKFCKDICANECNTLQQFCLASKIHFDSLSHYHPSQRTKKNKTPKKHKKTQKKANKKNTKNTKNTKKHKKTQTKKTHNSNYKIEYSIKNRNNEDFFPLLARSLPSSSRQ